ncbi:septum site-determining protein MinC [Clostridium aceticum]|uniref:Probable septum site-determining protein MinC n=1 Tax=Clostridium aceticum TaxID=84022 RepID=A0A0D8ICH9_9CLOT|nr:septum site-determining protein MinC [Clostridium aceticum]AKL95095.1 septum site-determining protein MinC [Clostridium aceticum]KJF27978.1 septum site-determining protein MinC [Clostridium aceticum]
MTEESAIEFKGTKQGLFIHIKPNYDFEAIKKHLIDKLEKTGFFFKGANIFQIECGWLTSEEKEELENIMTTRYNLNIIKSVNISKSDGVKEDVFEGISEGKTKFIKGTVRSGQIIDYDGNVVVLGDVNPGGQVVARGNIIVMGNLRGIAYAGSNGNIEACVAALYLDPAQLRIANVIARAPDGEYEKPKGPEWARIKQNMVYIEPYLNK